MKPILIVGATGQIGREVIAQLSRGNIRVRALVRNPDSAVLPAEVECVRGDLTIPGSLDGALKEIDTVFLVWTAPAAAAAPALERIGKHARRIVFLSSPHQTAHPFFQQPNPGAKLHAEIERLVKDSVLRWVFLRPGMFALNTIRWWAGAIRAGNVVRWPYGQAPTAPIHERNLAQVAARMLCEEDRHGKDYVLTGPQSLTQSEQLTLIGEAIGRSLRMEEISAEEARQELLAVMSPPVIEMLMNAWAASLGRPAHITQTVAYLLGRPALTFREWATDHAADFRPSA